MLAVAIEHRLSPRVVAANGSTTHRIAVVPRIVTALPRTDLAGVREVIRLLTADPAPNKGSTGRAETWPATLTGVVSVIVPVMAVSATAARGAAWGNAPAGPGVGESAFGVGES